MPAPTRPAVMFLCVKNGGKSQMAAALARLHAGDQLEVHSAGTAPRPGGTINELAAQTIAEVGASMTGESPKPIDPQLIARMDRVVLVGTEAKLDPALSLRAPAEVWDTDEPSLRGIEGEARMRLVRDDIDRRVRALLTELNVQLWSE